MLSRWVFAVWGAWLGALVWGSALTALQVWNPNPILSIALASVLFGAGIGLVFLATYRLARGPRRLRALAVLLLGTAPFWFLTGHVLLAIQPMLDRHAAPGWSSRVFLPLARPLADLEACWYYPERMRGKWVTMVGSKADDARAQVSAMDRHVEASLARLDKSETWPITWYRGALFGMQYCAVYDMAFGTYVGVNQRGADGLTEHDRHEVAHCLITHFYTSRSDPPRLLMEGWAEANKGSSAEEVAYVAWDDRRKGLSLSLRQLVAPDCYWFSGPNAYNQGAPLVNYLLRVYGPERFLKLYTTCQQVTFEADCRAILGIGLDELDAAYWADIEQIVRRAGSPSRIWLKGLKLAPDIDPAAWDAFLADYFDAAERLLAPFENVQLAMAWRLDNETPGFKPREMHEEVLLSGPRTRLRNRDNWDDRAYLATPDRSILAARDLKAPIGRWRVREGSTISREQSYRSALRSINERATLIGDRGVNNGMSLLNYPQARKSIGISTDYEVVTLKTATADGHRLVTLRLRTAPEVKGRDRDEVTFVFDADDSYVTRSSHGGRSENSFETQYEYDHDGGLPIFKSFISRGVDSTKAKWSSRIEVTECRFGPIPESEFSPESFLSSLKPEGIGRQPGEDRLFAVLLNGYWLAFACGGISVVGGSGLALKNRDRTGS